MKGKTICKTLGLVLLALLILVVLYVVYVFASYHRIGDQSLSVMHCSSRDAVPMEDAVETETEETSRADGDEALARLIARARLKGIVERVEPDGDA